MCGHTWTSILVQYEHSLTASYKCAHMHSGTRCTPYTPTIMFAAHRELLVTWPCRQLTNCAVGVYLVNGGLGCWFAACSPGGGSCARRLKAVSRTSGLHQSHLTGFTPPPQPGLHPSHHRLTPPHTASHHSTLLPLTMAPTFRHSSTSSYNHQSHPRLFLCIYNDSCVPSSTLPLHLQ